MPDRKIPPKSLMITHVPFIAPAKQMLDNGYPVYFLPGGSQEIMKIEWIFHAGSYYQKKPLCAFSVFNLMKTGTRNHSAEQISEILDFYGAYLSLDAQKDIGSVVVYVLNKNLDPILELMHEIIRYPLFPVEEADIFLKNQKHNFVVNNQKMQHLSRSHFTEALFGTQHPYGYRVREQDFDNLEHQDLLDFHKQCVHGNNGLCIVSGKIPDDFSGKLNHYFGDDAWLGPSFEWRGQQIPLQAFQPRELLIEKKEALQSSVRIGKRIITRQHPDFHKVMITNALLGGFFGSRLMRNIRQEKGYTYGIHSTLISLLREGYFFISTQVGVDVCMAATEEIYKEIKKLRTHAATQQELQVLKNYLSGNYLRSFDGPFAQGEKFKEVIVFGLSPRHFDDFLLELKQISALQIMEIAAKYLHEDEMTEVIAGKKELI